MESSRVLRPELEFDEVVTDSAGGDPRRAIVLVGQRIEAYARDSRVRRPVIRLYLLVTIEKPS